MQYKSAPDELERNPMTRAERISRQLQRANAAQLKREAAEQAADEQRLQEALARMRAKVVKS